MTVQQTYNTNIYDASNRHRAISAAACSGNWKAYSVHGIARQ